MDVESFVKGVAVGAIVSGIATALIKGKDREKVVSKLPEIVNQINHCLSESDKKSLFINKAIDAKSGEI